MSSKGVTDGRLGERRSLEDPLENERCGLAHPEDALISPSSATRLGAPIWSSSATSARAAIHPRANIGANPELPFLERALWNSLRF